jgi:hypothetical protein
MRLRQLLFFAVLMPVLSPASDVEDAQAVESRMVEVLPPPAGEQSAVQGSGTFSARPDAGAEDGSLPPDSPGVLLSAALAKPRVAPPAAPAPAADDTLERAAILLRGGAPRLALKLLEANEPPVSNVERWSAWEKRRFEILRALKDWAAVARRVEELPAAAPAELRRNALFEAAEARLALQDVPAARRTLRRLIWQEQPTRAELARAQRFVIRSYLTEDNLNDAQLALERYRTEHGRGESWQALHAEILLRAGKPRAAFEVLAGAQSHEARLLRLAAALRAGLYAPRDALAAAEKLARELRTRAELRRQALTLAAEAACLTKNTGAQVRLLEQALAAEAAARAAGAVPDTRLFAAGADELWSAYVRLAEDTGNRARLVVGNDQDWLAHAEKLAPKSVVTARALYAFLARNSADADMREAAHRALADSLFAEGAGAVAQVLYTRSSFYRELAAVPAVVRYRLADKALADYDIHLAAELVRDLKEPPPEDPDTDGWVLRRSRILVYAGEEREAAVLLSNLLESKREVDDNFAERYVQVLFDLQAVERNREALALLEGLYQRVPNERMRRELLYWRADSQAALGNHREAAELYLRSAVHAGVNGEDPWGHTARFHAAEQLGRAGLTRDARDVYARLLDVTGDPKRRLLIERQIQQLWIAERQAQRKAAVP